MSVHTLLEVLFGRVDQLQGNELEATLFKAGDDLANESTLDTIGLDDEDEVSIVAHIDDENMP